MITMKNAYAKNNTVTVGDVHVYDADAATGGGVSCSYIVVLQAPAVLKKSSKIYGVAISRVQPAAGADGKTVCLEIEEGDNRYIDCNNIIAVDSYRLGFKAGMVNEDCISAIFELMR